MQQWKWLQAQMLKVQYARILFENIKEITVIISSVKK